ncbi:alpha-E domain-containing protein [Algicella marina]|uniref:DUF403 domain-containing protein n=1 Tax=Algicella marina TaxID=2683284 RepID=A0A6P1T877_9RHOB|nr:alpha-E domain-containing protein [Algicella marina]QHQ36812.1 hypothetical protein GO499_17310 [Algicella marina]
MLSRTAENLFWVTRYMERAETMARLLEVGYRIALMPSTGEGNRSDWESIIAASGDEGAFAEAHGVADEKSVEHYLMFDSENPSSIASCIARARDNARIVRTAVTSEVWDALNSTFQEFKQLRPGNLPELCDWTKKRAASVRGSIESTQLQHDGYDFMNLGYYLERADNTARLLDVKYYVLLPTTQRVGGSVDNYQWITLLRSLSALRSFHWTYGGDYSPNKIAHFLILNKTNPRSLLHCVEEASYHLNRLARAYGQSTRAQTQANARLARLAEARVDDVIADGLHEFLGEFIAENAILGQSVADGYLFGSN